MNNMFDGCSSLWEIDVRNFNMDKVEDVTRMFASCSELTTIYCNKDWNSLPSISSSDELFKDCTKLKGEKGTTYIASMVGLDFARPDGGPKSWGYFTKKGLKGDVNSDGAVDIVDVTMTISHILGQKPANFNVDAADVSGDGNVNIVDVTSIIDIILNK